MKFAIMNMFVWTNDGQTKAQADVCFAETLVVKGIRLIEGQKGYFLGMPSVKRGDSYDDTCKIIKGEVYKKLLDAISKRYATEVKSKGAG